MLLMKAVVFVLFVPCLLAQEGGDNEFEPDEDLGEAAALPPRGAPSDYSAPQQTDETDEEGDTTEGGEGRDSQSDEGGKNMYKQHNLSNEDDAEAAKNARQQEWDNEEAEQNKKQEIEDQIEKMEAELHNTQDDNLKGYMNLQRQATQENNELSGLDIEAQQRAAQADQVAAEQQTQYQHAQGGQYSSQPSGTQQRGALSNQRAGVCVSVCAFCVYFGSCSCARVFMAHALALPLICLLLIVL
jgi:hypothetical protein